MIINNIATKFEEITVNLQSKKPNIPKTRIFVKRHERMGKATNKSFLKIIDNNKIIIITIIILVMIMMIVRI